MRSVGSMRDLLSITRALLGWLDSEALADLGPLGAAVLHRGGELRGRTRIDDLRGDREAISDDRICGDGPDVCRDALTQLRRHRTWTKQTNQAFELERRETCFH